MLDRYVLLVAASAGPAIDGPHRIRDGDAHRLVRVDDAGETTASLAVPAELALDLWGLSISPDGAWAFGRLAESTERSSRESMLFDTTTGALAEHDGCGSGDWQDRTVSFAWWSHSRLIAACRTGVWLAAPAEPAPVRVADAAYDVRVSHDGSRVLVVGAGGSRVVAPDGTDLGPAWPSTPEPEVLSWRRR